MFQSRISFLASCDLSFPETRVIRIDAFPRLSALVRRIRTTGRDVRRRRRYWVGCNLAVTGRLQDTDTGAREREFGRGQIRTSFSGSRNIVTVLNLDRRDCAGGTIIKREEVWWITLTGLFQSRGRSGGLEQETVRCPLVRHLSFNISYRTKRMCIAVSR
jgi:hypothetical protein